jgi:hypothetical protein
VSNGHLNVANGIASKHLKTLMFRAKQLEHLKRLKYTFKNQNGVKTDGSGCKIC